MMEDPLRDPALREPGLLERLAGAFLGKPRPLQCVQVEVTSHCGGKCVYCPHTTMHESWRSRHMADSVYAALWPLLRRSERVHLQGWGEPLLHPRFFDHVALARKAGCEVSSTICGLVMNEGIAQKLAASGMDMLAISLVGTDDASNGARTGVPLSRVREAVGLLRQAIGRQESPLRLHLAYLLLADRADRVLRLPELMAEMEIDTAVVSTLDYVADPAQAHLAYAPDAHDKLAHARELLHTAAQKAQDDGRQIHFSLPGGEGMPSAEGCRENIAHSLYVDADGVVSPCVYLNVPCAMPERPRRTFGMVTETDAWALWQGEAFGRFRAGLCGGQIDEACANCPKRCENAV